MANIKSQSRGLILPVYPSQVRYLSPRKNRTQNIFSAIYYSTKLLSFPSIDQFIFIFPNTILIKFSYPWPWDIK